MQRPCGHTCIYKQISEAMCRGLVVILVSTNRFQKFCSTGCGGLLDLFFGVADSGGEFRPTSFPVAGKRMQPAAAHHQPAVSSGWGMLWVR